ncbi:MAG: hypothetical protein AABZ33_12885 [Chloroflexota bacterium]
MSPVVVAAALALVIGAVVAVSARESRLAVIGLAVALVAAPLVADPLPSVIGLAVRLTGAILAAYLIRAALRSGAVLTLGTHLGWPVQVLQAVGAGAIGLGIAMEAGSIPGGAGSSGTPDGVTAAAVAVAAGAVAIVLAVEPIVSARDGLRLGVGLLLAVNGFSVVRTALLGSGGGLEHIVVAAALASIAAGTAVVCLGAAASGGGLALSHVPSPIRGRRPTPVDRPWQDDDTDGDGPR